MLLKLRSDGVLPLSSQIGTPAQNSTITVEEGGGRGRKREGVEEVEEGERIMDYVGRVEENESTHSYEERGLREALREVDGSGERGRQE